MDKTLEILPDSFWGATLMLLIVAGIAINRIRDGIGLPILAVLGTVGAWYMGDALYNDYANLHAKTFTADILDDAWWEVAWFILTFVYFTLQLHQKINGPYLKQRSHIHLLVQYGPMQPLFQLSLNTIFWAALTGWGVLVGIAFLRLGDQLPYYFFPFLGYRADPWGRGRLGGGFDSLLVIAGHLQLLFATLFGVVAALARNWQVRFLAMVCCCLSWPGYIFDRTRNTLLAMVIPGILGWVFIRLRCGWLLKLTVLAAFFLVVNYWMAFIVANRSETSISAAFNGAGISLEAASKETHHDGLNMFEELCWINQFIQEGTFKVDWGENYFSEIVNPIPRVLWPNKPMIGIDYAAARGQGAMDFSSNDNAGVFATISTGVIGQGVVNFGLILGPAFAAFLMALWAVQLARLDLTGDEMGNIPLFAMGMIFTFNLGRDITLITLYTFFFGLALAKWMRRRNRFRSSRRS